MKCPNCESENTDKVISLFLPMKFCHECNTLWGEPWATIYTLFIGPIESFFTGGFMFIPYTGSYIQGVISWFKGTKDE